MPTMSFEEITPPAGTVPGGAQPPASPAQLAQPAAVAIKPWQLMAAVLALVLSVLGFIWQMQVGLDGIRQELRQVATSIRQEMRRR